jgi:hypothetical protein
VFFSVELSVEEFWDTKSQIMGVGFGGFCGSNTFGSGESISYQLWVRANVFLGDLTQMEVFPGQVGVPVPYHPFTFATVVGGIYLSRIGLLSYDHQRLFWLDGWMDG